MEREGDPEAEVALHHGSRHGELQRGGEEDEAERQRRVQEEEWWLIWKGGLRSANDRVEGSCMYLYTISLQIWRNISTPGQQDKSLVNQQDKSGCWRQQWTKWSMCPCPPMATTTPTLWPTTQPATPPSMLQPRPATPTPTQWPTLLSRRWPIQRTRAGHSSDCPRALELIMTSEVMPDGSSQSPSGATYLPTSTTWTRWTRSFLPEEPKPANDPYSGKLCTLSTWYF